MNGYLIISFVAVAVALVVSLVNYIYGRSDYAIYWMLLAIFNVLVARPK